MDKITILDDLYEAMYQTTELKKSNLVKMAAILSGISHRPEPWQWKYLFNLMKRYKGFQTMPDDLRRAILALGAMVDGTHPLLAESRPVRVYGLNGNVRPDSVILGESQFCPYCGIDFVPNVPWRKQCGRCK
ncbi:hypothetical protein [Zhongshania sp.]|uniref:hypothetical protein n=1 Tax=Zhongshania sp. TaxID=1971902 RepID=UPI00356977BE